MQQKLSGDCISKYDLKFLLTTILVYEYFEITELLNSKSRFKI